MVPQAVGRAPWPPAQLVHRAKHGFGVPIGQWFRTDLRRWLEDILTDPRTVQRGYFHPAEVRRLLDEHLGEIVDHTSRLWTLVVLELWHRTWIDRG